MLNNKATGIRIQSSGRFPPYAQPTTCKKGVALDARMVQGIHQPAPTPCSRHHYQYDCGIDFTVHASPPSPPPHPSREHSGGDTSNAH